MPDIIHLDFGDTETPLTIYKRWRTIEDNGVVPVISVEKALEKFERRDLMLSSTCEYCYSDAKIHNLTLGYYERGPEYPKITFEPVWIMNGEAQSGRKFYNYVYARHFANFTASPTDIATFQPVQFTDTSEATPTRWLWDFGDGTNSTEQNPSHRYLAKGNYTVSLKAWNDLGSDTEMKADYVTVSSQKSINANFTATPMLGSFPLDVTFIDLTASAADAWFWDFGDGATSTEQNPVHTYLSGGNFTVSLTVWNSFESDSMTNAEFIRIYPTPAPAAFFISNQSEYLSPLTVQFTDQSEVSGGETSWNWDFGDGATSTEQNPVHTFVIPDAAYYWDYPVSLTVTDNYGRTSARTGIIQIMKLYDIDFSGEPRSGKPPLDVTFTDTSRDHDYLGPLCFSHYEWDFGDGKSSAGWDVWYSFDPPLTVTHTYDIPGNYTVTFTKEINNLEYTATTCKTDYIRIGDFAVPPVADFSASPTSGIAPLTVAFSDLSVNNPTSWNWDFGDATTSSVQHPAHKYTAPGTYTVSLLAANEFGSDKMTKADYVTVELKRPPVTVVPPPSLPPVTDFSANITSGKTPLAVAFSDLSTNGPTGWAWDFGDGTSDTIEDPVHTYAAPGMYTVTLTTTNPYGSDPETKIDYIMVLPLGIPDADFTANTTSGYAPLGVLFTDRSAGSPTSWAWDFENDAVVDSTDKAPFHRYSAPGTYTVRLAVGSGDGNDEEVKVDYIVVRQDSTAVPEFPLYIFPFL